MTAGEQAVAAYVTALGGPERITVGRLAVPPPGPTDVLVRTEVVAADPVDALVRSGAYPTPTPLPFIVGRDVAGTVVRAGPGAVGFAAGDRVWSNSLGHGGRQGSFAELVVVPADRCYHLPDGVDPVAVAVAHPAATAWLALFHHAHVRPGATVLVVGGAGNVGRAAIELAAAAGARVVATARGADAGVCRAAGATEVVDHRADDLDARVAAAAPAGVDVHLDTSGRHDIAAAVRLLAPGGTIVVIAGRPDPSVPLNELYRKDGRIVGFVISNATVGALADAATAINRRLARGLLPANVTDDLPLAETARVHRRLDEGSVRGRVVLRP